MFLTLYKSLARPHLEYGSSVWSVIFKKDAIQLENVQRRATKLIPNISNLSYENRLKHLGIPSLQYRRLRADIIQTYKIQKEIDCVDKNKLFPPRISNTRGHQQKIFKTYSGTNIRKHSFSQRIVDVWNSLPGDVVSAKNVNTFKSKLNSHWRNLSLKFSPDCYRPGVAMGRLTYEDGSQTHGVIWSQRQVRQVRTIIQNWIKN